MAHPAGNLLRILAGARLEFDLLVEHCHDFAPVLFRHRAHTLEDFGEALALYLAQFVFQFFPFRGKLQVPDPAITGVGRLFDITQIDHLPQGSMKILLGDVHGV